jgi:hypothetical protein
MFFCRIPSITRKACLLAKILGLCELFSSLETRSKKQKDKTAGQKIAVIYSIF